MPKSLGAMLKVNNYILRKIIVIGIILGLCSCGKITSDNSESINPKAKKLNDSAVELSNNFDQENLRKAVELLNKVTELDTNYFTAYWNKFAFLKRLNSPKKAFRTIKKLERLQPTNPELKMTAGVFYEFNGDSITAHEKFKTAERLFKSRLDTIEKGSNQHIMTQIDRNVNLIFLGQVEKGKEKLKELQSEVKEKQERSVINHLMNLSRKELIEEFNGRRKHVRPTTYMPNTLDLLVGKRCLIW